LFGLTMFGISGLLGNEGREGEVYCYRPVSKAGEAMGPSSVVIVKIPSNGRSVKGFTTSAETRAMTLGIAPILAAHYSFT